MGESEHPAENGAVLLQAEKTGNLDFHVLHRQDQLGLCFLALVGLDQLDDPGLEPHVHAYQQLLLKPKCFRPQPQQRQCLA